MAVCITCFMLIYVDKKSFNVSERQPRVSLVESVSIPSPTFVPLQSDVVTLLSCAIILLRLALGAWSTTLCWHSALFLMENGGLTLSGLRWVISAGVLIPPCCKKNPMAFLIAATLFFTLAVNFASPLLTGSISWIPYNQPIVYVPESNGLKISGAELGGEMWQDYLRFQTMRELVVQMSVGVLNTIWGRTTDSNVLKRAISFAAGLELNSTIANVTIPHFVIHSLEWIKDPYQTLTSDQRNFTRVVDKMADFGPTGGLPWLVGSVMLIPTTKWTQTSSPFPSMIKSETRLMLFYHSWRPNSDLLEFTGPGSTIISNTLPSEMGTVETSNGGRSYSFARVTFSAGASRCDKCRLSGPSMVQNDTKLPIQEDPLTNEALALAPLVAAALVRSNSSIPFPMNNINNYVEALLVRSYCGAWNTLVDYTGSISTPLVSSYHASAQVLEAQVNYKRVYIWLGLQLCVTIFGTISLFVQSRARSTSHYLRDTVLTVFYLDTSEVPVRRKDPSFKETLLTIQVVGDRLKVEPDSVACN
ncbi:hypothetical protein RSOLAG1IB_06013 [Rhizoctonia solani AG-1 IB]|uniref:Transmembrane protein n=1 Tax=Thanatephorus cucumeris (strain AG1-IB / isolate 7/3/14) TaxID=1108050 RepID=A0A0B7F5W4_THACB|nr:hypothetical protein RSOLAG1IB_06013 [Rhizoctonia solani AG-1 IB]